MGKLRYCEDVRELTHERLVELVDALDIGALVRPEPHDVAPLPAVFRLAADGSVVPDLRADGSGPQGVSAGRAQAKVTHDAAVAEGAILVVDSLDPGLASALPQLAGLVSQTGSPLSHLAILAREHRIPVVVGYREELSDGDVVIVDGSAGTVEVRS